MKQVAGSLRLDLAQYRELAAFAQFGSDLDKSTQAQLARGHAWSSCSSRASTRPMPVEQQVLSSSPPPTATWTTSTSPMCSRSSRR